MGKKFDKITPRLQRFIEQQKIFFTGTAMEDGRVNVSPKGMDTLRVVGPNRVMWLNLTGSGNETSAHLQHKNRLTIMFCAFEGPPLILRLYGKAKVYHPEDPAYKEHISRFPDIAGSRQIFDMEVDLLQTSCGMGVPLMDYKGDREELREWAEDLGEEGVEAYWKKKNRHTIDGVATNIPVKD